MRSPCQGIFPSNEESLSSESTSQTETIDTLMQSEQINPDVESVREFEPKKPSSPFEQEVLMTLGWPKLLAFFSTLCQTEWGRTWALELPFFETKNEVERELEQVTEALWLHRERAEDLPISSSPDLRKAFYRLEKGGSLEANQLLDLSRVLETTDNLHRFLKNYSEELPALWLRGDLLESLPKLRREIESAIDEHAQIRDRASWELETLRREVRTSHERIRRKLQEYLSSPRSRYLTDTYFTLREDRYVLPVRASEQSRFPGIVYGSSGSGATVYIEPQPLVNLNNALRMAENEVVQEEARILRGLSQMAARELPQLWSDLELLKDFDLLQAKVRMAEHFQASIPILVDACPEAVYSLKNARHPLLILKETDVVANDLILGGKHQVLVISGPNTGGKTVSLKALGICALMARAGLPIPADEGSEVPLFDSIFTDIGDRQSIEQDLSTFSAQILRLKSILERADEKTLVLIDEIVVGTDPNEGSCLAAAILQSAADRKAMVAVTTHYEYLKALAYEDDRFQNASVGFDLQKFAPTYRVYLGTPGGSSALEIARRLGLSEEVCQKVESMMSEDTDRFDMIVSKLEQQYQELYEERDRATRARQRLEKELLASERQREQLEKLEERMLKGEERSLRNEFREARETLRETIQHLKKNPSNWSEIHKAGEKLKVAQSKAKEAIDEMPHKKRRSAPPTAKMLKVGQKVHILSLKNSGEIVKIADSGKDITVRVGALRMRVRLNDIEVTKGGVTAAPTKKRKEKKSPPKSQASSRKANHSSEAERPKERSSLVLQTRENSCDLRGMRVEEAVDAAEAFLDKSFHQEFSAVLLIHGHGTGALRKAIRELCRHSAYVENFRPGQAGEGGDGVTVIDLS